MMLLQPAVACIAAQDLPPGPEAGEHPTGRVRQRQGNAVLRHQDDSIRMLHWFSCNSVRMFHDGDVTVARGEAECNSDSPKWNISGLLH